MPVSLTQVHNMASLSREYKWDISFPAPIPSILTEALGGRDFEKNFNIRCISTQVPKARIEEVTAAPRGIDLHEPGLVHLDGQITFNLVDTVDLVTRRVIYALRQICMSDENKIQQEINSAAADYARGISGSNGTATTYLAGNGVVNAESNSHIGKNQGLIMRMVRLDNHNRPIWQYVCYKCFLMDYTDPDFSNQSNPVLPSITIRYNYFVDSLPTSTFATLDTGRNTF